MLTQLSVKNHTLVDQLDIGFNDGLTAITGETGAGKSILLNALGLTLGDRAEYDQIRQGAQRAEVQANFDLKNLPEAAAFLQENELDEDKACLLRRVINTNGTSKAWINGQQVTLSVLRILAEKLISIHSQHEHQCLLKADYQQKILDDFGDLEAELGAVRQTYDLWHKKAQQFQDLKDNRDQYLQRKELLEYQVRELDELGLGEGEFESLEAEQKQLSNAEEILKTLYQANGLLSENENFNLLNGLRQLQGLTQSIDLSSDAFNESNELISDAMTQLEEARDSLRRTSDSIQIDPERLQQVEERLSVAFDLARKHRCEPGVLSQYHTQLSEELTQLVASGEDLDTLEHEVSQLKSSYDKAAVELSNGRAKASIQLTDSVQKHFYNMNMQGAELKILLTPCQESALGVEKCNFLIRTNPGQEHKPLARIASGGELSRMSLAIQVVTAQSSTSPTLVFDEVDVGIGGATANAVGNKLRELGENTQVICVTHLAQVASQANQQLTVVKDSSGDESQTRIFSLDDNGRATEIARMLSGDNESEHSLRHAEELLKASKA